MVEREYSEVLKQKSVVNLLVKPNSSKTRITGYDPENDIIKIDVKAPPEGNRANDEIIRFLGKITGKDAKILHGKTSKRKTVRLF